MFPGSIPAYQGFTGSHTLSADNHAAQSNAEQADIIALATKMGTGASTPTNNLALISNGVGSSAWGQVSLTAGVTGVLPLTNGGTGGTSAATAAANLATEVGKLLFPIGCVYTETTGTNPGTSLGFGTWIAFGAGRVLIGNGTSDANYAAGATGGESNHTLITAEMPSHTHGTSSIFNVTRSYQSGGSFSDNLLMLNNTGNNNTQVDSAGGGGPHNNLQPYLVCYFWKRTA